MGGKYSSYPVYKDSNDTLLGSVPEHWQLTRVKYVAHITPKKPIVDRSLDCSFVPMEKLKTDSIVRRTSARQPHSRGQSAHEGPCGFRSR